MVFSCLMMVLSVPAPFVESSVAFMTLVSAATMAHGMWTANALTLPTDLVPQAFVGSVYGISGTGGGLGGFIFVLVTGIVADKTHSFNPIFVAIGLVPIIAALIVLFGMGEVQMLEGRRDRAFDSALGSVKSSSITST